MTQLLDITTLVDRPTVKIDGVDFQLRNRDELGLVEFHRIIALHSKFSALQDVNISELSEKQTQEVVEATDSILKMLGVKPLPLDKLSDVAKSSIVQAWADQYSEEAAPEDDGADPT